MKIVLWIGNAENQKALAARIHSVYKVDAIFLERKKKKRTSWVKAVSSLLLFPSISGSWKNLMDFYKKKEISLKEVTLFEVENINSGETYNKTLEISPDLIIVSGTRIIKDKLLSLKPRMGILNLHTGLSPYIKGGPNCTNWCIATGQLHLIGNTIMWLNEAIDAGDIVVSRLCDFKGSALYLHAIEKIIKGFESGVPQNSISKGLTFYTSQWDLKQKFLLVKNFKKFSAIIHSKDYQTKRSAVKTIDFKNIS